VSLLRLLAPVFGALVVVACAAPTDESDADGEGDVDATEGAATARTVSLKYEGTCDFLPRDWEASNGVMEALGLPFGLTGRCSGYGGGRVTVKTL
jgi:hypothetical protein